MQIVYKSYGVNEKNENLTRFVHTFNSISNTLARLKSIDIKNKSNESNLGCRRDWFAKRNPLKVSDFMTLYKYTT